MNLPKIAVTMGDPAGVGPELIVRLLHDQPFREVSQLLVFGDAALLRRCSQQVGVPIPHLPIVALDQYLRQPERSVSEAAEMVDVTALAGERCSIGQVSPLCGEAAYRYIDAALKAALSGRVQAVTTAPISKEALHAAGHCYPGHTEIFAERAATSDRWCMMQYSATITCTFVTVHCGYSQVPLLLTTERILDTIELTHQALQRIRGRPPRLLVCGLNPHAGEHGLFGDREEERFIVPAVTEACRRGIDVTGPWPADTVFLPERLANCDAVVCMYHDQGHIPVKALAFDSAVNTTLGLSIVRTSVDHGTAFDIAWQGKAKPDSLYAAIRLAAQLAR